MSAKVSGDVWERKVGDPIAKLVLLALVDHADHEGNDIFPGNELLMAKTELSRQTITSKIQKFVEDGVLIPVNTKSGRGNKNRFSVDTDGLALHPYFLENRAKKRTQKGVSSLPLSGEKAQGGKGQAACPFPKLEKGQVPYPFIEHEKGQSPDIKGQFPDIKGQSDNITPIRTRAFNRHEPSHEPSGGVAPAREADSSVPAKAENLGGAQVEATPMMQALFAAQGWVIDLGTPEQWRMAKQAEKQLAVYDHTSTPATPELVARAGRFYEGRDNGWRLSFLGADWPQICRMLVRSGVSVGRHVPTPQPSAPSEVSYDAQAAFEREQERKQELFEAWWNGLHESERARLRNEQRASIVTKLPKAREWGKDVMEQTIHAALFRGFNELPQEVSR